MGTGQFNAGGNPEMDQHPIQGGVEILLVIPFYRNQDKLRLDGSLGLYADLTEQGYSTRDCFQLVERLLKSKSQADVKTFYFQLIQTGPHLIHPSICDCSKVQNDILWTYLINLSNFIGCKHNRRWRNNEYLNRISSSENKSTLNLTFYPKKHQ